MPTQLTESELTERLRSSVADLYTLGDELGRGGMSVVHRAWDIKGSREVAIKILRPELAATIAVDRFLREIRIAEQMQHEQILGLYDSGEVAGAPFYVMPYVDGRSLRTRLDTERQLPIDEALRIAINIANTLDYAHKRGRSSPISVLHEPCSRPVASG
jgi:serine/threonine protein kinase